jgi:hypothetical protein
MDEFGASRLYIYPASVELIADLERVISDGRGGILKSYSQRDPYSKRTHLSDALGYLIAHAAPVGSASLAGVRRRQQIPRPAYGNQVPGRTSQAIAHRR